VGVAANEGRRVRFGDLAGPKRDVSKRVLDVCCAGLLLFLLLPVLVVCALAIKLDSRGPVFFRARRVGRGGRELRMFKFRKMAEGAAGPALTAPNDERFTRVGRVLAATKLDELPQLFNVLRGEMSLVGPRPEDPTFVELHRDAYGDILRVTPGITGLSQIAFARENRILLAESRVDDYVERILPQKTAIDVLYAARASFALDAKILLWTSAAVLLRVDVAVNRSTGALSLRRRRGSGEPSRVVETAPIDPLPAASAEVT
jgi:lipopolysaccharide/colanic/teichoic acid biosynthesis glycosyltransferase